MLSSIVCLSVLPPCTLISTLFYAFTILSLLCFYSFSNTSFLFLLFPLSSFVYSSFCTLSHFYPLFFCFFQILSLPSYVCILLVQHLNFYSLSCLLRILILSPPLKSYFYSLFSTVCITAWHHFLSYSHSYHLLCFTPPCPFPEMYLFQMFQIYRN